MTGVETSYRRGNCLAPACVQRVPQVRDIGGFTVYSFLIKKKNTNTCGENTGLRWPALLTLGWTSVRAVSWAGRFRGEWTRAWITQPGRGLLPGWIFPIDETDLSSENQLDILKHIDLFISEDGFFFCGCCLAGGWVGFTSQCSAADLKHNFWETDFCFRFCFNLLFYTSECLKIVPISISMSVISIYI